MTDAVTFFRLALCLAVVLLVGEVARGEDESKPGKPEVEGRPVYIAANKVVVFPKGVEAAPEDYQGAIGARPLALIRFKDEIVGEVYAASLEGTPSEEAKGMAASVEKSDKIKLLKRATTKDDKDDIEVVTLRMDLKNKIGTPWILHSLYFPRQKASTTFKLVASEQQFGTVVPIFEAMLFFDRAAGGTKESKTPEAGDGGNERSP